MKQMSEEKKPFFAYITTNAPHGPFIAPPKMQNDLPIWVFPKEMPALWDDREHRREHGKTNEEARSPGP